MGITWLQKAMLTTNNSIKVVRELRTLSDPPGFTETLTLIISDLLWVSCKTT